MNKMLVAVFDNDDAAFAGVTALKALHSNGDISLYALAVIGKDADGKINEKQVADEGPIGSVLGMFTGAMVGLLGGPGAMVVGGSLGGLTGLLFDLNKAGVDVDFLADVGDTMAPGKCAILANLDESWTTPVDNKLGEHGAVIFRRARTEVEDDQIAREKQALSDEWDELKKEWHESNEENKAKIKKKMDDLKLKAEASHAKMKKKMEDDKAEFDAKMAKLKEQAHDKNDEMKQKIHQRETEMKQSHEKRMAKLHQWMDELKAKFHGDDKE